MAREKAAMPPLRGLLSDIRFIWHYTLKGNYPFGLRGVALTLSAKERQNMPMYVR